MKKEKLMKVLNESKLGSGAKRFINMLLKYNIYYEKIVVHRNGFSIDKIIIDDNFQILDLKYDATNSFHSADIKISEEIKKKYFDGLFSLFFRYYIFTRTFQAKISGRKTGFFTTLLKVIPEFIKNEKSQIVLFKKTDKKEKSKNDDQIMFLNLFKNKIEFLPVEAHKELKHYSNLIFNNLTDDNLIDTIIELRGKRDFIFPEIKQLLLQFLSIKFMKKYRNKNEYLYSEIVKNSITVTIPNIPYAHRLHKYDGVCYNLHGHNGKLVLTLYSDITDKHNYFLVDFKDIKYYLNKIIKNMYDHKFLFPIDEDSTVIIDKKLVTFKQGSDFELTQNRMSKVGLSSLSYKLLPFSKTSTTENMITFSLMLDIIPWVILNIYNKETLRLCKGFKIDFYESHNNCFTSTFFF